MVQYLRQLQKTYLLDPELCDYYCDIYERSRFSLEEFDEKEYQTFLDAFLTLIQSFKRTKSLKQTLMMGDSLQSSKKFAKTRKPLFDD
jgi:hypothetical protein